MTRAGDPNPNLYYLTCPYLLKRLSQLEDQGAIDEIQSMLDEDDDLATGLAEAQEAHRLEWLEADRSSGADSRIDTPNIAGTGGDRLLKCLHAHYAFHILHQGYRLGEIIEVMVGEPWCEDQHCGHLMDQEAADR